jgi:hypothetical protein
MVTLMMSSLEAWFYTKERVIMAAGDTARGGTLIPTGSRAGMMMTINSPASTALGAGVGGGDVIPAETFSREQALLSSITPSGTPVVPSTTSDIPSLVPDPFGIDRPFIIYGLLAHGATWSFHAMSKQTIGRERLFVSDRFCLLQTGSKCVRKSLLLGR